MALPSEAMDSPLAPWWYAPNQVLARPQSQEPHTQAILRLEAGLCRLQERLSDAFLNVEERINNLESDFKKQCDKHERAQRHTSTACKGLRGALEAVASRVNEIASGLEALADCTTNIEGKIQQESTSSKSPVDSGITSADLAKRLKNYFRSQEAHHDAGPDAAFVELQQFLKEVLQKEFAYWASGKYGFPQVPQPVPQIAPSSQHQPQPLPHQSPQQHQPQQQQQSPSTASTECVLSSPRSTPTGGCTPKLLLLQQQQQQQQSKQLGGPCQDAAVRQVQISLQLSQGEPCDKRGCPLSPSSSARLRSSQSEPPPDHQRDWHEAPCNKLPTSPNAGAHRRCLSANTCQRSVSVPDENPKRSSSVIVPPVARVPVVYSSETLGQQVERPIALPVIAAETCVRGGNDASANVVSAHSAGITTGSCGRSVNAPASNSALVKRCLPGLPAQRVLQARSGNHSPASHSRSGIQSPLHPTTQSRPGQQLSADPTTSSWHGIRLSPASPLATPTSRPGNLPSPTARAHTGNPSPVLPTSPRQLRISSPSNVWHGVPVNPASPIRHSRHSIGVLPNASSPTRSRHSLATASPPPSCSQQGLHKVDGKAQRLERKEEC